MSLVEGIIASLIAAFVGAGLGFGFKSALRSWKSWRVTRRFRKSFTTRTRLVRSGDKNANWDAEALARCEQQLLRLKILFSSFTADTLGELWHRLEDTGAAQHNLILLGSPVRLKLAEDFLFDFEDRWFEGGHIALLKSETATTYGTPNGRCSVQPLVNANGVNPVPHDSTRIHPVKVSTSLGNRHNLIWPGIMISKNDDVLLFPKYPFEANLKGATFRGYEHALVLVVNGQMRLLGQPGRLTLGRIVMLMGYSGPSTLAAAEVFFGNPELFEPGATGGAVLSVLEVPVACDQSTLKDTRYVPANSARLIWRFCPSGSPLTQTFLPYQLLHTRLELTDRNQVAESSSVEQAV